MISLKEKKLFLDGIRNTSLHVITEREVDGKIFQLTGHSLGADLLKLFDMALKELEEERAGKGVYDFQKAKIVTSKYVYWIDRTQNIPILYRKQNETEIKENVGEGK